ncbi:hypothetical protein [Gemmobacter caeni]|uniref:Uncharacterized protein n=1 Tax=Gemmobacter caeni TaxID=589035 RepID=A0A2T6B2Q5_9RHOB|nr:hypothetical protein [Gemmobacter caeni]PTX50360.1 hypothetical protein C8N34_1052 [Gemmobacter caeni]
MSIDANMILISEIPEEWKDGRQLLALCFASCPDMVRWRVVWWEDREGWVSHEEFDDYPTSFVRGCPDMVMELPSPKDMVMK